MESSVDVTILIVNWNVRDLLARCLESIFSHTRGVTFEVIVIDNASSDGSPRMVADRFPQVRLFAESVNHGFSKANNLGLRHACGRHIVFLNPDTELIENSIKTLVDILDTRPEIALLAPRLLFGDHSLQTNVKRDPTVCDQMLIALKVHHFFKPACLRRYLAHDFRYDQDARVEQVMGAALAARGSAIKKLGGWNESYFVWWEDIDLCTSAREAGYGVFYSPATTIIHHEGRSFAQQRSVQKQIRFMRGMRTYFKTHRSWHEWLLITILTPFSIALAAIAQVFSVNPRSQSRV